MKRTVILLLTLMIFPHKSWAKGDMNAGGEATTTSHTVTMSWLSTGSVSATGLWYACNTSPHDPQLTIWGRNEYDGVEGALTCNGVTSWKQLGTIWPSSRYRSALTVWVTKPTPGAGTMEIRIQAYSTGVSNSAVFPYYGSRPTCGAAVDDVNLGNIHPGKIRSAELNITKSGTGNGTVVITGPDLRDGALRLGGNNSFTVRPSDKSYIDVTTGNWVSGPAVNTVPLTVMVGNGVGAGTYTSYLTATLTCE